MGSSASAEVQDLADRRLANSREFMDTDGWLSRGCDSLTSERQDLERQSVLLYERIRRDRAREAQRRKRARLMR